MMLSRNAEGLYWMARYMQRADSIARIIEVAYRMSMVPSYDGGHMGEWSSILDATGTTKLYHQKYHKITPDLAGDFLLFDEDNPSSVMRCVAMARQNARAFRPALTTEVWDSINLSYFGLRKLQQAENRIADLPSVCDTIKHDYVWMRGAFISGQLDHEGSDFFHVGCYLEQAESTARILDVKYYVLLPSDQQVGGQLDYSQWSRLLRALSGWRAFHYCYGADYTYANIANFLIFEPRYPRSILYCRQHLLRHLEKLSARHDSVSSATELVRQSIEKYRSATIDSIIIDIGLHEFLGKILHENLLINDSVAQDYLFGSP